MTKQEFYSKLNSIVTTSIEDLQALSAGADAIETSIKSGQFTAAHIRDTLRPKLDEAKRAVEARREVAKSVIRDLCSSYAAELAAADELDSAKLTDDVRLLNCGVKLSSHDLEVLFDKNAGNNTMLRLIAGYAAQNGIKIARAYRAANEDLISYVNNVPQITDVVLKWHDQPQSYAQLIGENSSIHRTFAEG